MDGIIEFMVKKEKTTADTMKVFGLYAAALVLSVISITYLNGFGIVGCAAAVYLAYFLSANFSLEFEYCVLGKDLRIDKIMSRKKRKPLIEINGTDILAIIPQKDTAALQPYSAQKTIFAAGKENDDANYVIVSKTAEGITKTIVKPNEKILEHYKTVLPGKVF